MASYPECYDYALSEEVGTISRFVCGAVYDFSCPGWAQWLVFTVQPHAWLARSESLDRSSRVTWHCMHAALNVNQDVCNATNR